MKTDPHTHTLLSQPGLLWEFANRVYANPKVETFSIALQDQYEANVNIMLWSCWLKLEGIELPRSCLAEVVETINEVSHQTVDKLREVRRYVKTSHHFTKVQVLGMRKHILSAELVVEKLLLQRLQDLTCRFLETVEVAANDEALDLAYYLEVLNIPNATLCSEELFLACSHACSEEGVSQ